MQCVGHLVGTLLVSMEYFTRQITLQDRLKQHECQLYPLFGSCLELRDDSPGGRYQASPLDLSRLVPTDKTTSQGTDRLVPTDKTTSPGTDRLVPTDKTTSPGTDRLVPTDKTTSPETDRLVPIDKTTSPGTDRLVPTDKTTSPETDRLVPIDKTTSPETDRLVPTDKSTSLGNDKTTLTNKSLPPGNPDSVLHVHSTVISNNDNIEKEEYGANCPTEGETSSPEQSLQHERPTKRDQDTIQPRAQCDTIIDLSNPLLKQVLESEEPTVSAVCTMTNQQNTKEMLQHVKHMHESNSSLHRDHEHDQSSSTMNNEHVNKQCNSTIPDCHETKQSDSTKTKGLEHNAAITTKTKGLEHNAAITTKTKGLEHNATITKEHKQHNAAITDFHESKQCNSPMADDIPMSSRIAVKDATNSNPTEPFLKNANSRKRRRRVFLLEVMKGYVPDRKRLRDSKICPNVNVTDCTDQFIYDRSRCKSENESHLQHIQHATNCMQPRSQIDLSVSKPRVEENHDQMSSESHCRTQVVMSAPCNVSLTMNTSIAKQSAGLPLVVDTSPRQCVPPPTLSLTNSQSEFRPDQNLFYPCSQSNVLPQEVMTYPLTNAQQQLQEKQQYCHHQLQQQIQHIMHPSPAASADNNRVRLIAPLDLSTKTVCSREQLNPAINSPSVSEETRIKEISDNLRVKLLRQSSTVLHSCPGICLGHTVGPIKGKRTSKRVPPTRHIQRFPTQDTDQASIIIDRQILLNLDYQHLLNIDRETSPKFDHEISSYESSTTDIDSLPNNDEKALRNAEQQRTRSVDQKGIPNIDHKRSTDVDKEMLLARDLQMSPNVSHNMSPGVDRKALPMNEQSPSEVAQAREQIVTSVSTQKHTDGSHDRTSSSMAWNLSVSKTIGLHSDCNNCKACRRIFAKLSIPPIEELHVPIKPTNLG